MSESSFPSVEDDDLADDSLQDLIKEAETLMQDLPLPENNTNTSSGTTGSDNDVVDVNITPQTPAPAPAPTDIGTSVDTGSTTINIGGNFSIDDEDDDDDDDDGGNDGIINNDPLQANMGTGATSATPIPAVQQKEMHDHPLHPLSADRLSAPTTSAHNTPPTSGNSANSNAMPNIFNGSNGIGMMNMGRVSGGAGEAAAAAAAAAATTSIFASNLVLFATGHLR